MRLRKVNAAALACLLLLCAQAVQAANKLPKGEQEGVGKAVLQGVPIIVSKLSQLMDICSRASSSNPVHLQVQGLLLQVKVELRRQTRMSAERTPLHAMTTLGILASVQ